MAPAVEDEASCTSGLVTRKNFYYNFDIVAPSTAMYPQKSHSYGFKALLPFYLAYLKL